MSLLSSWNKRTVKASQFEEKPQPIRGGVTEVIRLCDADPLRVYNELVRRGNEHRVVELNDKHKKAVQEYKDDLIGILESNEVATV
jgi:hypothetical protein